MKEYKNIQHSKMKMKQNDVNSETYTAYIVQSYQKKFRERDFVQISIRKSNFTVDYVLN